MNPITIAILTYNRPEYLATALRSACNQQLAPAEILIVDDGSTADTQDVVDAFGRYTDKIRYIWQENAGHSAARNRAFEECQTSHLMWLDDDDALTSNAVLTQLETLEANPNADIIYGKITLCDQRLVPIEPVTSHEITEENALYLCFKHNPLPNPGTLISKKCFSAVGEYSSRFKHAEDYDFFARAASKGVSFVRNEHMIVFYRSHPANLATATKRRASDHERVWVMESLLEREAIEDIFYFQPWENLPERALFNSCLEVALHFCRFGALRNAVNALTHARRGEFVPVVEFLKSMIEAVEQQRAEGLLAFNQDRNIFEGPGEQLLDVLLEQNLSAEDMDLFRARLVKTYLENASLQELYWHYPWKEQPKLALLSACLEHACRCVRYGDFEAALETFALIDEPAHLAPVEFIRSMISAYQDKDLDGLQELQSHPLFESDLVAQLKSVFHERSERYRIIERERLFSYEGGNS